MTSIYAEDYRFLLNLLVEARKKAGMTQQELADMLERPQSFVSKFEHGERRLDVVEYLRISRLLGADPTVLMRTVERRR